MMSFWGTGANPDKAEWGGPAGGSEGKSLQWLSVVVHHLHPLNPVLAKMESQKALDSPAILIYFPVI